MEKRKEYEQHMSSIEIADITGKPHEEVMEAIKKMEETWKKVNGREFMRVSYQLEDRGFRTCYFLTKEESLYVAYEFSLDVHHAVLTRWEMMELELMRYVFPNATRIESNNEILEQADDIIANELEELNRTSKYCHKTTEIAKQYRMSASDMLSFLADKKIVQKVNGHYELARQYRNKGLEEYYYKPKYSGCGKRRLKKTIVWTDEGKRFIKEMINKKGRLRNGKKN